MGISAIDTVILVLYFMIVMGIGVFSNPTLRKKAKIWLGMSRAESETADPLASPESENAVTEYFLAGRDATWWAVGASLFASNIGSEHFVGLSSGGAASGFAPGLFEWLAPFSLWTLGWLFAPHYRATNILTTPQFLLSRFDSRSKNLLAFVSILAYIFTKVSVALYSGAVILRVVYGVQNQWFAVFMIILVTGIYVLVGGMSAVIYTEVMQTVVLLGGALILMVFALVEVGGPRGLLHGAERGYFSVLKSPSDGDYPITGILFGFPVLSTWYWCTDHYNFLQELVEGLFLSFNFLHSISISYSNFILSRVLVQRVLSSKSNSHTKVGCTFAGYLKLFTPFAIIIPGIAAAILFPEEINGHYNDSYPLMVKKLLPTGLVGLLVAAMFASLMSSLAAVFNSASTIFTLDFYHLWRPNASQFELVMFGRVATVLTIILGILWIPILPYFSNQIWLYLQSVQTYLAPGITATFTLGIFYPRATPTGAFSCLIFSTVIGILRLILELAFAHGDPPSAIYWFVKMNFLHFGFFSFILSCIVLIVVSAFTKQKPWEEVSPYVWDWNKTPLCFKYLSFWNRSNYSNLDDEKNSSPNLSESTTTLSPSDLEAPVVQLADDDSPGPVPQIENVPNQVQPDSHAFRAMSKLVNPCQCLLIGIVITLLGIFH